MSILALIIMKSATAVAYSTDLSEEQNHWVTLSSKILNYACELGVSQEGRAVLCKGARLKYRFINEHRTVWGVMTMCWVLCVARAGFYAWLHNPVSARDKDNQRLLTLIRDSYSLSGGVYGYRWVHGDLNEIGEACDKNRVGRIMQLNRIKAACGSKAPRRIAGRPSVVAPNGVQRQFTVVWASQIWITDITHIRTWQGWLYLAVVIDLFARNVIGWSMKSILSRELVLDALINRSRRAPNLKNRTDDATEQAVVDYAIAFPAHGQHRTSNELRKQGVFISGSGVRSVWLRHNLENFKKRLKALEEKVVRDGIELTDSQIAALERKASDDEACGEIETAHPGYLGSQDTFYVGNLKGVGRIYQQTFVDTYSKVAHCKLYVTKTPIIAADLLNDRVLPFYASQGLPMLRILTDRGPEYCGKVEEHDYQLYVAINDIEHTKTKAMSPADQRHLRAVP